MRKLNAEQKKRLRLFYNTTGFTDVENTYLMSLNEIKYVNEVYNLNPHETFWQNANRFLWDIDAEDRDYMGARW